MSNAAETIRLEEFTGVIQSGLIAVWSPPDSVAPWLPTEFLQTQYITRILVVGRTAPMSMHLAADPGWTQVWRSPGAKEWSCMLGVLQHMPGPILIVVGPDVVISPKLAASLKSATLATIVVLRTAGQGAWPPSEPPTQVFFPVLGDRPSASLLQVVQESLAKAAPKGLDLKAVLPSLNAAGYGLTVANGLSHWYRPADSTPMVSLTVAQVARQLQIMGLTLEKMGV
jgi:hypothetical protein